MSGFYCKNCDSDLSLKVDLLARSVAADHSEDDPPEELTLEGLCGDCGELYSFHGEMFTHFVLAKSWEGTISSEAMDAEIVEVQVSIEDAEEFKVLMDAGDQDKLQAFIKHLMEKDK